MTSSWTRPSDIDATETTPPTAQPAREWSGVLEAEWMDRGLSQETEDWLHLLLPMGLAVMALPCLLLALISPASLLQTGAMFLWCCFVLLVPAAWLLLRHRPRKMVMRLDPGVCRVVAITAKGSEVFELPRVEAGLLRLSLSRNKRNEHAMLQLEDETGRVRIELIDRRVRVLAVPLGVDFGHLGIDPKAVPLSTLIGSWWPDAGRRVTRTRPSWWRRRSADGPWRQPDLDGYAVWKARQLAWVGLYALGAGAFGVVVGVSLLDRWSAADLPLTVPVAIGVPVVVAWGLFALRRASRSSQQHGGPGLPSVLGAILRRNG